MIWALIRGRLCRYFPRGGPSALLPAVTGAWPGRQPLRAKPAALLCLFQDPGAEGHPCVRLARGHPKAEGRTRPPCAHLKARGCACGLTAGRLASSCCGCRAGHRNLTEACLDLVSVLSLRTPACQASLTQRHRNHLRNPALLDPRPCADFYSPPSRNRNGSASLIITIWGRLGTQLSLRSSPVTSKRFRLHFELEIL